MARVGRVGRARGLAGEVEVEFTDDAALDASDYLVCDCDGLLVPFFWEEFRFKNRTTAIVKFEFVDSAEQARRLCGAAVYVPREALPATEGAVPARWADFGGYTVLDASDGSTVGTVEAVDERSANVLFIVRRPGGGDVMLPAHADLVRSVDAARRLVALDIPDGLLDMN